MAMRPQSFRNEAHFQSGHARLRSRRRARRAAHQRFDLALGFSDVNDARLLRATGGKLLWRAVRALTGVKRSCAFIEKSSGCVHTSVAIRNKKRPGSFGVTPLGALDAVAASPPHPPDCSVPSPRRGIGALLHPSTTLQADARALRNAKTQLAWPASQRCQ